MHHGEVIKESTTSPCLLAWRETRVQTDGIPLSAASGAATLWKRTYLGGQTSPGASGACTTDPDWRSAAPPPLPRWKGLTRKIIPRTGHTEYSGRARERRTRSSSYQRSFFGGRKARIVSVLARAPDRLTSTSPRSLNALRSRLTVLGVFFAYAAAMPGVRTLISCREIGAPRLERAMISSCWRERTAADSLFPRVSMTLRT